MDTIDFIISYKNKKLWQCGETEDKNIDWSDRVDDWESFLKLIRSGYKEKEKLMLTSNNFYVERGYAVFVNPSIGDILFVDPAEVMKNKLPIKIVNKEEVKMDEKNEAMTPEERIEALEKEKAELWLQIKNQKKYDDIKKSADELFLIIKAFMDAGFTRPEAMELLKIGAEMNSDIPPFLRGL